MWEHTLNGDAAPKTKPATQPTIVMGKKKLPAKKSTAIDDNDANNTTSVDGGK
ncbi:hypothetical protein PROFUN_14451 [Planoprotostelium fungivorum]|uniref:Uncharacterized protein n=1 Tax=Planoprotostelium fungivorum TaxID=1890364 RepID=A0A2P6MXB5_9EUKA|nr:hypothetical protein PROFUN_14451 [Planoprotostelium fungivorum]